VPRALAHDWRHAEHLLFDERGEDGPFFGLEVLIDDIAPPVYLYTRIFDLEKVRVRFPPACQKEILGRMLETLSIAVPGNNGDAVVAALDIDDFGIGVDFHATAERFSQRLRYLGFLIGDEPHVSLEDRDAGTHGLEEMGELGCNVSSAEDDHALGPFRELQGALVRQVEDGSDASDRRDERRAPDTMNMVLPLDCIYPVRGGSSYRY
jgi:hypothetical protein